MNVLKNIGFSANLLSNKALEKIKEKYIESTKQDGSKDDEIEFSELTTGTGALIASRMRNRRYRKNLIRNLANDGTVLSMRKDINLRKELRIPPNRVSLLSH